MTRKDYGLCPICGEPMVFEDDEDVDLHTWTEDGTSDVHAECCIANGCPTDAEDDGLDDFFALFVPLDEVGAIFFPIEAIFGPEDGVR